MNKMNAKKLRINIETIRRLNPPEALGEAVGGRLSDTLSICGCQQSGPECTMTEITCGFHGGGTCQDCL